MSIILGTSGNNILTGTSGSDLILAGNGNDTVDGGNGSDVIDGGNGNDTLTGGAGNDIIVGDDGNDTIDAGAGCDLVLAGSGNDLVIHRASENGGLDAYDGGHGSDTLRLIVSQALASSAAFQADLAQFQWQINHFGSASGYFNSFDVLFTSFEQIQVVVENGPIVGTNNDDILTGTAGNDIILALDGNDEIDAQGGNDAIDGGAGLDRSIYTNATAAITVTLAAGSVTVGTATDTLQSVELIRGSAQADSYDATGFSGSSTNAGSNGTFNEFEGMGGNDIITGNGDTRISYVNATGGVVVDLATGPGPVTGTATGDASVGADQIMGGVNAVRGSEFDDIIRGTAGNDNLEGRGGDDQLAGRAGNDTLDGGDGFDTALYGLAGGPVNADLAAGTVILGTETDTVISIEAITGSAFNDTLRGDGGANTLTGNDGNDFLIGRLGNDTLIGGNGIDIARFSGLRSAYTLGIGTVTGPDGTDTTNGVELLQFDDAYVLGFGISPINLTGFGLMPGLSLFGRNGAVDLLTMGTNANGRLIDLGGGPADIDTLTLGTAGASYSLNLANVEQLIGSSGNEIVTFTAPVTNNILIDLGIGTDALNLSTGNDTVTVTNVGPAENVFNAGGVDTVTFLHNDLSVAQTFNLGFSSGNTLILAGSNSSYSFQLFGNMTVLGASTSGNEIVSVANNQAGTIFDLGAGTDSLTLNSSSFPNGVTVANVEQVEAIGSLGDTIVIAGNSGGVTTVTAGGGSDQITASADEDHFRFMGIGDSPYVFGAQDIITGFDADGVVQDVFVFDGIPTTAFSWEQTTFFGNDIVRIDFDGDAVGETGWDMLITLNGLVGALTNDNFLVI